MSPLLTHWIYCSLTLSHRYARMTISDKKYMCVVSSMPSDGFMRQFPGPALVQIIACCLFGNIVCWTARKYHRNFDKIQEFVFKNCIRKRRLKYGAHFVWASVYWLESKSKSISIRQALKTKSIQDLILKSASWNITIPIFNYMPYRSVIHKKQ